MNANEATESGLLVFKIMGAQLSHRDCFVEVVMDDMLFPAYSSAKARTQTYTFNETGDALVRELDLSRITLRLVEKVDSKGKGDEKEEAVMAKITGSTLDTLKRCLYTPTQISLKDKEGRESKVTVSMRYLPVQMQLDLSESFNNSGSLRVEVLDAADLPAADRNGYSDPFCRFSLNGKEVYKTKTQKKTLHPAWNEFFEVSVRSRTAAKFEVNVMDWDFGDKADFLGAAVINLDVLEPFQPQEVTLGLDGKSGALRLKMLFKPDYVTRSRQSSSTFSGTFSTPGKIIGAPVKGVGKGAVLVGGGVAKGASFLGRGFKRRTASGQVPPLGSEEANGTMANVRDTSMDVPALAAGTQSANGHVPQSSVDSFSHKDLPATPTGHQRQRSFGHGSPTAAADQGTATISVLSASGFSSEHKIEVHILHDTPKGLKEVTKTEHLKPKAGEPLKYDHEGKKIPCAVDSQFRVQVKEHRTFGNGEQLGEAAFFVNDQAQGGQQDVKVGPGLVSLRTSFQPAPASAAGDTNGTATSVPAGNNSADSPATKKAGGLGRFVGRRDRSVTPLGPGAGAQGG